MEFHANFQHIQTDSTTRLQKFIDETKKGKSGSILTQDT